MSGKGREGDDYVKRVTADLAALGYVVLREKSYRQAQERQRVAEARRDAAVEDRDSQRAWLERDVFPWQRHLAHRVDHLAALAISHGATWDEMRQTACGCGMASCPVGSAPSPLVLP